MFKKLTGLLEKERKNDEAGSQDDQQSTDLGSIIGDVAKVGADLLTSETDGGTNEVESGNSLSGILTTVSEKSVGNFSKLVGSTLDNVDEIATQKARDLLEAGSQSITNISESASDTEKQMACFGTIFKELKEQRFTSLEDMIAYLLSDIYTDEMDAILSRELVVEMLCNPVAIPIVIVRETVIFIIKECVTGEINAIEGESLLDTYMKQGLEEGPDKIPDFLVGGEQNKQKIRGLSYIYMSIKERTFSSIEELVDYILENVCNDTTDQFIERKTISDMLCNPGDIQFILMREMVFFILENCVEEDNSI